MTTGLKLPPSNAKRTPFAISCHSGVTLSAAHAFDLAGYIAEGELGQELNGFSQRRFDV